MLKRVVRDQSDRKNKQLIERAEEDIIEKIKNQKQEMMR